MTLMIVAITGSLVCWYVLRLRRPQPQRIFSRRLD